MESFKKLVDAFTKLPGVGPRQATRFALSLLHYSQKELEQFARLIYNFKDEVKLCTVCYNISDQHTCLVCRNAKRNKNTIMVVEKITDLESIERTGQFKGVYHVLGGALNPPDNIGPEHLTMDELFDRVSKENGASSVELILATNPTTYGDTTALYIEEELKKRGLTHIKTARLARGLSSQTALEYADELTLKHALEQRK